MPANAVTVTATFRNASDPPTQPNPPGYIFSTGWEATPLNWILFFVFFGWIWMWFI